MSLNALGQTAFIIPSNTHKISSYGFCKDNHLAILGAFKKQIDHEINRIIEGIVQESIILGPNSVTIKSYYGIFQNLILKRIFVEGLIKQLSPIDLTHHLQTNHASPVFHSELMELNLKVEIQNQLKIISSKNSISNKLSNEFSNNLLQGLLEKTSKKLYSKIGSGLFTQIILNNISRNAFNKAIITFGSEVFTTGLQGTIITAFTSPLMGYRYSPEQEWVDILKNNHELILNPDWMKDAELQDNQWVSHCYAILRKKNEMEDILMKLIKKEEAHFLGQVAKITALSKITYSADEPYSVKRDMTLVKIHPNLIYEVPYWSIKKD